jgi:tetratricopeptide (TPR) repeat protein
MSPEQLRGDSVDARSDLFQVGEVLYESLAGRPPFPGATPAQRLAVMHSGDLDFAAALRSDIPPDLSIVLSRALETDMARRYATAAEFLSDLQRLGGGGLMARLPETLAIVDLRNLAGDPGDDWIGSGVAESLGVELFRVSGLTVVDRGKVLKAREALRDTDLESHALRLGLALGCRWVLSGSFQRAGDALRITARLTEIPTGRVAAAEKLDGTLSGLFEMQDRLSASVINALHLERRPVEPAPAPPQVTAFECYARGRRLWVQFQKGESERACELYEQAVTIDPSYAPALAGLAAVHGMRFNFTTDPEEIARADEYATRALAADPGNAEAHIWKGYCLGRRGGLEEACETVERALKLDPSNWLAPNFAGLWRLTLGRAADAIPYYQRALELEPTSMFSWLGLGMAYLQLNRLLEARHSLERAVEIESQGGVGPTAGAAGYLGECLRRMGALEEARLQCVAGLESAEKSDHTHRDTFRAYTFCALGRTALDRGQKEAAQAAYVQAIAQLRGRPGALAAGHLFVQALAGLTRSGGGSGPYEEAQRLFAERNRFDFHYFYGCSDDISLLELARAARALGSMSEARAWLERARAAGSREPFEGEDSFARG